MWRRIRLGLAGLAMLAGLWIMASEAQGNPLVDLPRAEAQQIAKTAATVYFFLRVINSALSMAENIEIGASVGAQATMQPLKILEPIDDTVERVAEVVFVIAAGAVLTTVAIGPIMGIGLLVGGAGLLAATLSPGLRPAAAMARIGLGAGVLLPAVFVAGVHLGDIATAGTSATAMETLREVQTEATALTGVGAGGLDAQIAGGEAAEEEGFFSRLGDSVSAMGSTASTIANFRETAALFVERADDIFSASLTLIGVFVLRMLVLPLFLLWIGVAVLRGRD